MYQFKFHIITLLALLSILIFQSCNREKPVEFELDMLTISDSTLSFFARAGNLPEHPQRTITVTINKEQPVTRYHVANQSDWLKLGPFGTDTIFVTIRSESLEAGQYNDTIVITSALGVNTPLYLLVDLTITNWFQTSHDSLQFNSQFNGNNPPSQFIQINDFTNANSDYKIRTTEDWIIVTHSSGRVPDTFTVSANSSSLEKGSYRGFVIISSDDEELSDINILITLEVKSWFKYPIPPTTYPVTFEGINFIDKKNGVVSGWYEDDFGIPYGVIYCSSDSGKSWQKKKEMKWFKFGGVSSANSENWWVAASRNTLIHTSDQGENWTVDSIFSPGGRLNDIQFVSVDSGWTIGQSGIIGRTIDGGANWENLSQFTRSDLHSIYMYNNYLGWVCGDFGTILQTIDGGATWTERITNSNSNLIAIDFVDRNNGWAIGVDGILLSTNSGGALWTEVSINAPRALYDISFANNQLGWISGENGVIMKTTNGGNSWQPLVTNNASNLKTILTIDEQIVWVIGSDGTILQTVSGGK